MVLWRFQRLRAFWQPHKHTGSLLYRLQYLPMQMYALMKKWSVMYWRSPAYNLTRFLMTTLIALFYGTMYLQKGHIPKSGELMQAMWYIECIDVCIYVYIKILTQSLHLLDMMVAFVPKKVALWLICVCSEASVQSNALMLLLIQKCSSCDQWLFVPTVGPKHRRGQISNFIKVHLWRSCWCWLIAWSVWAH